MASSQPASTSAAIVKSIAERLLQSADLSNQPWSAAVRGRKFDEAINSIEQSLLQNSADPQARLWWVRCHLEAGKLPLAALSAPLDEMFEGVLADQALCAIGAAVYSRAAAGLIEKNQLRLAVTTLEKAAQLGSKNSGIQSGDLHQLREQLRSLIIDERGRAESRRENRTYLNLLEEKLKKVEQDLAKQTSPVPAVETSKKPKPGPKMLSAKSIVLEAETETVPAAQPGPAAATSSVNSSDSAPQFPPKPAEPLRLPRRISPRAKRSIAACLVILATIFGLPHLWRIAFPPATAESIAQMTSDPRTLFAPSQAILPIAELTRASMGESNNNSILDSVHNRLKNLEIAGKPNSNPKDESEKTPVADANAREKALNDPEVDQTALHWSGDGANKANGSFKDSPFKQNQEQQNGIAGITDDRPSEKAVDPSKVPQLDPNRINVTGTDSLGDGRGVEAIPGILRGGDGRIYGPPMEAARIARDTIQDKLNQGGRGLDGSAVQPIEVEQYSHPAEFRIIAPTKVLSAPSIVSAQVENLPPNSKVEVTAKMGQWLEIRSVGGRVGYIYSQDAAPTN